MDQNFAHPVRRQNPALPCKTVQEMFGRDTVPVSPAHTCLGKVSVFLGPAPSVHTSPTCSPLNSSHRSHTQLVKGRRWCCKYSQYHLSSYCREDSQAACQHPLIQRGFCSDHTATSFLPGSRHKKAPSSLVTEALTPPHRSTERHSDKAESLQMHSLSNCYHCKFVGDYRGRKQQQGQEQQGQE